MVTIEINGQQLQVRKGAMVIEAADEAGITIPRFCYHKKLSVAANCRMCLVEVEKVAKPLPACATPVTDGMKIFTKSAKAIEAQKSVMEFLLINHPLDCPICDQGGECDLQDLAMGYGKGVSRFSEKKRVVADKSIGSLITTEMTRCIHCTRCVRFGQEVAGIMELGATGRGEHTRIGTYVERAVDSEMSGNVIDLCPVGALTSKPYRYTGRPWENQQHESIAPHDCLGSNIYYEVRRNQVMRVLPRENEQLNEVWISDRDRFSYTAIYSDERVRQPMIKQGEQWETVPWETALTYAVEGLNAVREQKTAAQIGALISPSATLEEHYLLQKLLRGMGSNNIDHRLRQQDFNAQQQAPLFPGLGMALAELENLDAVLLLGSWVRKDQPIAAHRLRKAARKGAAVMVLNALDYDFNLPLAEHLVVAPAQMPLQLAGIAKALLVLSGKAAPEGAEALLENVSSSDDQVEIARQLANAEKSALLIGTQAMHQEEFSSLQALAGLIAELSDATLGFLPEGANSSGASLAGTLPHRGAAGAVLENAGKHTQQMLSEPLGAYLLFGVEPEFDCANPMQAQQAMEGADFVVSFSAYVTDNMKSYADVILPISLAAETGGSFVNAEGCWQSFQGVVEPQEETRPGWKILRVLGNLLQQDGFAYVSVDGVRNEVKTLCADQNYSGRLAWHCPSSLKSAGEGLQRIGHLPMYATDPQLRRAAALQQTSDAITAAAYLNMQTANTLGVHDTEMVTVEQDGMRSNLQVVFDEGVPDDCVFIPPAVEGSKTLGNAYGRISLQSVAVKKSEASR